MGIALEGKEGGGSSLAAGEGEEVHPLVKVADQEQRSLLAHHSAADAQLEVGCSRPAHL